MRDDQPDETPADGRTEFYHSPYLFTITSCIAGAERSFSTLKRNKNWFLSTMSCEKFQGLSTHAIESDLTCELRFDDVISYFAMMKPRRVVL